MDKLPSWDEMDTAAPADLPDWDQMETTSVPAPSGEKDTSIGGAVWNGVMNRMPEIAGAGVEVLARTAGWDTIADLAGDYSELQTKEAQAYAAPEGASYSPIEGWQKGGWKQALINTAYGVSDGAGSQVAGLVQAHAVDPYSKTAAAIVNALMIPGEMALKQKEAGVENPVFSYSDFATATGAWLTDFIPGAKYGGLIVKGAKNAGAEGLREVAQEGMMELNAKYKGQSDASGEEVAHMLGDAFILGAATKSVTGTGVETAKLPGRVVASGVNKWQERGFKDLTEADARAAERVQRQVDESDGAIDLLDTTRTQGGQRGAQQALFNAHKEIKAEFDVEVGSLSKALNKWKTDDEIGIRDHTEAKKLINQMKGVFNQGKTSMDAVLEKNLRNSPIWKYRETQKALELLQEQKALTGRFQRGFTDIHGGISRYTQVFDVIGADTNTNKLGLAISSLSSAMQGHPGPLFAHVAGGYVINRVAGGIDRALNQKSIVKRWIERSADYKGDPVVDPEAVSLNELVDARRMEKQARAEKKRQAQWTSRQDRERVALERAELALERDKVKAEIERLKRASVQDDLNYKAFVQETKGRMLTAAEIEQAEKFASLQRKRDILQQELERKEAAWKLADEMTMKEIEKKEMAEALRLQNILPHLSGETRRSTNGDNDALAFYHRIERKHGIPLRKQMQALQMAVKKNNESGGNMDYESLKELFLLQPKQLEDAYFTGVNLGGAMEQALRENSALDEQLYRRTRAIANKEWTDNKQKANAEKALQKGQPLKGNTRKAQAEKAYADASVYINGGNFDQDTQFALGDVLDALNDMYHSKKERRAIYDAFMDGGVPISTDDMAILAPNFAVLVNMGKSDRHQRDFISQQEAKRKKLKVEPEEVQKEAETVAKGGKVEDKPKAKAKPKKPKKPSKPEPQPDPTDPDVDIKADAETVTVEEPITDLSEGRFGWTRDAGNYEPTKNNRKKPVERIWVALQDLTNKRDLVEVDAGLFKESVRRLRELGAESPHMDAIQYAIITMADTGGYLTQTQLTEAYAAAHKIDISDAAKVVHKQLGDLEEQNVLKKRVFRSQYLAEGEGYYHDATLEFNPDTELGRIADLAKAYSTVGKIKDVKHPQGKVDNMGMIDENIPLIKKTTAANLSARMNTINPETGYSFLQPLVTFADTMSSKPMRVDPSWLSYLYAHGSSTEHTARGLENMLRVRKSKGMDQSGLAALSQLMFQVENYSPDGKIYQGLNFGENGRHYWSNGSASSQSGDVAKASFRSDLKAPAGKGNYRWLMHQYSNIIGYEKVSPNEKEAALLDVNSTFEHRKKGGKTGTMHVLDALEQIANDPFPKNAEKFWKNSGLFDQSEGPMQAIRVARDVKEMVEWAQRNVKGLKDKSWYDVLTDKRAQEAIEKGWETDMFVQMDANNNAYQLIGLQTADPRLMQATGMLPIDEVLDGEMDIMDARAEDIYLKPVNRAIAKGLVPDIAGIPQPILRKMFKGGISTKGYSSSHQTQVQAAMDEVLPKGYHLEYFQAPEEWTGEFEYTNKSGTHIMTIAKVEDGYQIQKKHPDGQFKKFSKFGAFPTEEEAKAVLRTWQVLNDANSKVHKELVDMFPGVGQFMGFATEVTNIMKNRYIETNGAEGGRIKIPTPDGAIVEFDMKEAFTYVPVELEDGIKLGVRQNKGTLSGNPLGAAMAHSLDGFVMRRTAEIMRETTGLVGGMNTIHDSFGFHPSEAAAGHDAALQAMWEVANVPGGFDLFNRLLEVNGIDPRQINKMPDIGNLDHIKPEDRIRFSWSGIS